MKKFLYPFLTLACLFLGFVVGHAVSQHAAAQQFNWNRITLRSSSKVDELFNYMRNSYVDALDMDSLEEEAIADMVAKLDPHSSYIPKKDIELVNSELGSSFSGIGVQFTVLQDTVQVVQVISGGPSERVGVLAGDKIVEVDDSIFCGKGTTNEKVMHTLRGPKGTHVKLGILRSGTSEILQFDITRGDIPVHAILSQFMIAPKVGFITIDKFSENTYTEFMQALTSLKAQGAEKYILDFRQNGGGLMDQTIRMANEFLEQGDMIVYAEGRSYPRYEARANGLGRFKNAQIIVLIDEFSASASEIFAGAMQDNDRATIIGRRSFGKGLVQQQMPFSDGAALRLTVARYYTPSGRCIQRPYTMGEKGEYETDLLDRFEHGEAYNQDSIVFKDTTAYYTKAGKVVRGGGGIMPDYFVGIDTTLNTPYYNRVVNRGYTYQFAYRYTDQNREKLSKYKDWQSLEKYLKKQNWMPEFVRFCEEKGVEPNAEELAKSRPLLERLVQAYIVRNILGDEGFYPLFERDDKVVKEALRILSE